MRITQTNVDLTTNANDIEISLAYQFEDEVTGFYYGDITIRLLYPKDDNATIAELKAQALRDAPKFLARIESLGESDS